MSIDKGSFGLREEENRSFEIVEDPSRMAPIIKRLCREYRESCCDGGYKAKVGCQLDSLFVDYLKAVHSTGISVSEKSERIESTRQYYSKIMGERDFGIRWAGSAAEFACMSCFEEIGYPVYKPAFNEDFHHGLDFWIDLEKLGYVGVQVKTLAAGRNHSGHMIFPVQKNIAIEDIRDCWRSANKEMLTGVFGSYQRLSKYIGSFTNTTGVMLILDSPESGFSLFDGQTGIPTPNLTNLLCREFEEKMVYAQREVA